MKKELRTILLRCLLGVLLLNVCVLTGCENEKDEIVSPPMPTLNVADSLALIDFYTTMKGAEWADPWDLSDPTTWHNVKYEYDETTKLKYVNGIWINRFYCVEGSRLPETLGNLKRMQTFCIEEAPGLEGTIPESLFDCPLRHFYFQNIPRLEGPLSPSIGKLGDTVEQISMLNCPNFYSEIPPEFGQCDKARYIILGGCGFYGKVPIELRNLTVSPMLWNNHLSEVDWRFFTEDIGIVPDMANNDFRGTIPEEILQTERWKKWGTYAFYPFNEGYGFSNFVWM